MLADGVRIVVAADGESTGEEHVRRGGADERELGGG